MTSCVLDIETAPLDDADISPTLVDKLKISEGKDWRDLLGIYAPSAQVVTAAFMDLDTGEGRVLVHHAHGELDGFDAPPGTSFQVTEADEREILRRFWEEIPAFDRVISYNGRRFDVPFLMQRSLILEVGISTNLVTPRTQTDGRHLDLADLLSLFGATRPYGLAVWAETIGEASPKEGAVQGADVATAFADGRIREIAEYCARDVVATAALARRVLEHWDPLLG